MSFIEKNKLVNGSNYTVAPSIIHTPVSSAISFYIQINLLKLYNVQSIVLYIV